MIKKIIISIFAVSILTCDVYAHPGRTDGSGCHTCKTNCARWGLYDGEYHCHNGNTYTNSIGQVFNSDGTLMSDSITNNDTTYDEPTFEEPIYKEPVTNEIVEPDTDTTPEIKEPENDKEEIKLSDDNTLKSVSINGENVKVEDNITYKSKDENIEIKVEPNDASATYEIEDLGIHYGIKNYYIYVTSASGKEKKYLVSVEIEDYNHENTSTEDNNNYEYSTGYNDTDENSLLVNIMSLGVITGGGYGFYKLFKKEN